MKFKKKLFIMVSLLMIINIQGYYFPIYASESVTDVSPAQLQSIPQNTSVQSQNSSDFNSATPSVVTNQTASSIPSQTAPETMPVQPDNNSVVSNSVTATLPAESANSSTVTENAESTVSVGSQTTAISQETTIQSQAIQSTTGLGETTQQATTTPAQTIQQEIGVGETTASAQSSQAITTQTVDNSAIALAVANNFYMNQNLISSNLNQANGWQSSAGPVITVEDGMTVNAKTNFTIYQDIVLPDENMAYTATFSCAQKNKSGILSKEDQGSVEIIFIKNNGTTQSDSIKLSLDSYLEWTTRTQNVTIPLGTKTVRIELNGVSRKLQLFNPDAFIDTYFKDIYFGFTSVSYGTGDGTSENPFRIYSPYGMEYMLVNLVPTSFYKLESDVNMTGLEWAPLGTRMSKDNFSYNGHTVSGLPSSGVFGYNINFNTNGGEGVAPLMDLELGTPLSDIAKTMKTGYTFAGWYKDEALTQPIQVVEGNMTLYAGWTVNQYTLSFVVNRGDLAVAPMSLEYNTVPQSLPNLESHGFTFDGWYKDMALLERVESNTVVTENTTYYGKWEDNYVGMLMDISKSDIRFEKSDDSHFYIVYNGKTSIDYTNNTEITITGSSSENQIFVNNGVNASICLSSLEIRNGNKNPLYLMPQSNIQLTTKGKVFLQTSSNMSCIYLSPQSNLNLMGEINLDSNKDIAIGANGSAEQGTFTLSNGMITYGANQDIWIIVIIVSCIIFVIIVLIVFIFLYKKSKKKAYLGAFSVDSDENTKEIENSSTENKETKK